MQLITIYKDDKVSRCDKTQLDSLQRDGWTTYKPENKKVAPVVKTKKESKDSK